MAARIAHYCPGYGNPWKLTLGQWLRIIEVIPELRMEASELTAAGVQEGIGKIDDTMRTAQKISRRNQRNARRLQAISGHRGKLNQAR